MKLQADQAALAEGARWIARQIPNSAADPVALTLLLTAGESDFTLAYNSAEVAVSVTVDAHVVTPGKASVSGRIFADILAALPDVPVEFNADDNGVDMVAGTNTFRLSVMDTASYPALPALPALSGTVAGDVFAQAVSRVETALDFNTKALPELSGIRVTPEGDELVLTATDRYRVAVQRIPWTPNGPAAISLIPGRTLADIAKAAAGCEAVQLALPGRSAGVQAGSRTSIGRLLDIDRFPQADRAFPKEYSATLTVDAGELAEAVKRIGLLLEGEQAIELHITADRITVQAMRNAKATGSAQVDCQLEGVDIFDVAFNPRYLLDGLAPIDGAAQINLTTPKRPALIHAAVDDPDYRYLVVPIRDINAS